MPTLADFNLDSLRPPGNPDDFELIVRPVFSEHWTREVKDSHGKVIAESKHIGPRELSKIVDRCNNRILDTNDFSPIVVKHTSDEPNSDPELVGFSGPFFMGTIGNLNPKAAIYAKTWVFKEKRDTLKRYPRLSVEYWCSPDDPGNGYFDPISLLGATTPELDLGIHYAKTEGKDRRLIHYSQTQAAYPGGSNTFVPGTGSDDDPEKAEQKTEYSRESEGMLSPEAIQQLIVALKPVIKQEIDSAVAGMKAIQPGDGDGLDDQLDGEFDELDLDDDADLDIGDGLDGLDDEDGDEEGLDDELGQGDGADDDLEAGVEETDTDSDLDKSDDTKQPDGSVAESADDDPELSVMSEEDKEEDDMADSATKGKPADKNKQNYERQPAVEMTREQYAKENRELRERYEKQTVELRTLKDDLAAIKSRVDASEAEKRKAVRYSKLNDIRSLGFVLDVESELADVEPLTDEQFDRHCTKIVERYAKAPINRSLPIPASERRDGVPADMKKERYAKVAFDAAMDLRNAGKPVDYEAIRANVERNDGKYVPAS